jgi:hypothetical protein
MLLIHFLSAFVALSLGLGDPYRNIKKERDGCLIFVSSLVFSLLLLCPLLPHEPWGNSSWRVLEATTPGSELKQTYSVNKGNNGMP